MALSQGNPQHSIERINGCVSMEQVPVRLEVQDLDAQTMVASGDRRRLHPPPVQ